ncbi:MAG TPA: hypothetical protein VEW42_02455 [Candidatus Eisenbacteria bacterium]|nr:hypothetical protein [Candidatus Eisenbacteria bacterium]
MATRSDKEPGRGAQIAGRVLHELALPAAIAAAAIVSNQAHQHIDPTLIHGGGDLGGHLGDALNQHFLPHGHHILHSDAVNAGMLAGRDVASQVDDSITDHARDLTRDGVNRLADKVERGGRRERSTRGRRR